MSSVRVWFQTATTLMLTCKTCTWTGNVWNKPPTLISSHIQGKSQVLCVKHWPVQFSPSNPLHSFYMWIFLDTRSLAFYWPDPKNRSIKWTKTKRLCEWRTENSKWQEEGTNKRNIWLPSQKRVYVWESACQSASCTRGTSTPLISIHSHTDTDTHF